MKLFLFEAQIKLAKKLTFKNSILFLIGLRAAALAVADFLPISLPGVWRQTDTLGVAMRYWLRWTSPTALAEGDSSCAIHLLPAVMNSGDSSGIMPMEFPLLNFLFAPAFAGGPYVGKVLGFLGILVLFHGLIYLNFHVWKNNEKSLGVESWAVFLIAVASFTSGWTGKFIPDVISAMLVLLAVGMSWNRPRTRVSFFLCTLGLLMKPTAVVILVLFLAHPQRLRKIRGNFYWGFGALVSTVLYYTAGMKWIQSYQDGPSYFAVGFRPFFASLIDFFSHPRDWLNMWQYRAFFSLGLPLVLALSAFHVYLKRPGYRQFLALWGVLIFQYVLIAGLDGSHGFVHDYYFIPLAPTACFILGWLISHNRSRFLTVVIYAGILFPTLELSSMDLKYLYKPAYQNDRHLFRDCATIKNRHPEVPWQTGAVFRTSSEEYPTLEVCFGERGGSHRFSYGFFWRDGVLPSECQVIEAAGSVTLAACSTSPNG